MPSEAGAVIGILFAVAAVAILYWLKIRYYDRKPVEAEELYDEVRIEKDGGSSPKNKSQKSLRSKQNADISTLLFPAVSNPMVDVERGNSMDTENEEDYQGETLENVFTDGISKAGYLKKKSSGIRKDWLIRYFFIKDGKLFYVHESEELVGRKNVNARQVANLLISTAKEISDIEFQIISPGHRGSQAGGGIYELQGDNRDDMNDWVRVIRQQIEGALTKTLSSDIGVDMRETASAFFVPGQSVLEELRAVNLFCADCGALAPEWASLNLCIMVCIDCSGIHRKLGTHVSKVRSIALDKWTYNSLQLLLTIGNERSNAVWEAQLPQVEVDVVRKPTSTSSMEDREKFIIEKYVHRNFAFARNATMAQKEGHLIKSAADGDLIGIMAAIAAGADINVKLGEENGEDENSSERRRGSGNGAGNVTGCGGENGSVGEGSRTALHLACLGQHTLCVELLCQMSASVDVVDAAGFTPLDIAIGLGYKDVQDILRSNAKKSPKSSDREAPL